MESTRNKKIKIIPLAYKSYNYGGTLQYYALERYIISLEFDCCVLDIDDLGNYVFPRKEVKRNKSIIVLPKKLIHKIKWEISNLMQSKVEKNLIARKKNFDDFRDNFVFSSQIDNLDKVVEECDAIIAGSDQIWNPQWAKDVFFFTFMPLNTKKIVYAASIGKRALTEQQLIKYAELLKNVDAISVREKDSICMLQPYINKKIECVMDPVFLLNKKSWESLALNSCIIKKEKYAFCYLIGEDAMIRKKAKAIAKRSNLKTCCIPYISQRYIFGDTFADDVMYNAGPIDFLKLIIESDLVITDSFHATAFSIILHKQFFVLNREPETSNMLSRIETLLGYFNLETRLVTTVNEAKYEPINWMNIDRLIEKLSFSSKKFIIDSLNI